MLISCGVWQIKGFYKGVELSQGGSVTNANSDSSGNSDSSDNSDSRQEQTCLQDTRGTTDYQTLQQIVVYLIAEKGPRQRRKPSAGATRRPP